MGEIIEPLKFMKPEEDSLYDVTELDGIDNIRQTWKNYKYLGRPVPRMTSILDDCIGKSNLMYWAAGLGNKFRDERIRILDIGSKAHEMIEYYLKYKAKKEMKFRSYEEMDRVETCYTNFVDWFNLMTRDGYVIDPLYIEQEIVCPWFGGTADCIMRINDKIYVTDFKTSKQISMEYLLQTYGYMWAINWNREMDGINYPIINGIGIIRVDKFKRKHETMFLDYDNSDQANILNELAVNFGSMINWYYHQQNLKYNLSQARIKRNGDYA